MKKLVGIRISMIFFVGILFCFGVKSVFAQNTINGLVFDDNRKPVANIDVELLDGFERFIKRTKTNGSGLYIFPNLSAGIYYVQVKAIGTNFKKAKERINLGSTNRQVGNGSRTSGVENRQKDFYLQVDPQRKGANTNSVNAVVFAQNVPKEAQIYYQRALKNLKSRNDREAVRDLVAAIRVFPDYFNAHMSLGEIYLAQKKYIEAESVFGKAAEINPKSFTSYFNLAIAQNNLGKAEFAAASLKAANQIDGNSINSHLLLGIIQRKLSKYAAAEKTLLKAKTLGKNKEADVNWQLAELYYFNLKRLNDAAVELDFYLKNLTKEELKSNPNKITAVKKLIKKIRNEAKQTS